MSIPVDKEYLENLVDERFNDESKCVEWKSHLRYDLNQDKNNPKITAKIIKTMTAFANTDGGKILIGINEKNSTWTGIEKDGFRNGSEIDKDRWIRHVTEAIIYHSDQSLLDLISYKFVRYEKNITIAILTIERGVVDWGAELMLLPFREGTETSDTFWMRAEKSDVCLTTSASQRRHIKQRNQPLHRGWPVNNYAFLTKDLMTQNWKDLGVCSSNLYENLPGEIGLYMYYARVPRSDLLKKNAFFKSFMNVIYAGSGNIKDRFRAHENESDFELARETYDNNYFFVYCLLEDKDLDKLKIWEGQLIDMFSPSLNLKREAVSRHRPAPGKVGQKQK